MSKVDIFNCSAGELGVKKKKTRDIQALAENFIKERSSRSFNALMKRCSWGLHNYIFNMVKNEYDTNIVMSITMEHLFYKIDKFKDDIGKFSTWMYRIAHNDAMTFITDGEHSTKIDMVNIDLSDIHERIDADDNFYDNGEYGIDSEIEDILFKNNHYTVYTKSKIYEDIYDASVDCIQYLPNHLRIVMMERYINRKKVDDIANENHMAKTNVKNWLRKGGECLMDEMKCRYPDLLDIYNDMKIKQ